MVDRSVIRPIAICAFVHNGRVLVGEGYDSIKQETYHRPVGGALSFGETSREAVIREIREELGVEMRDLRLLEVIENIFSCEGVTAHEIVFAYHARFRDDRLYSRPMLRGCEARAGAFAAVWRDLDDRSDLPPLHPEGLEDLLKPLCH